MRAARMGRKWKRSGRLHDNLLRRTHLARVCRDRRTPRRKQHHHRVNGTHAASFAFVSSHKRALASAQHQNRQITRVKCSNSTAAVAFAAGLRRHGYAAIAALESCSVTPSPIRGGAAIHPRSWPWSSTRVVSGRSPPAIPLSGRSLERVGPGRSLAHPPRLPEGRRRVRNRAHPFAGRRIGRERTDWQSARGRGSVHMSAGTAAPRRMTSEGTRSRPTVRCGSRLNTRRPSSLDACAS